MFVAANIIVAVVAGMYFVYLYLVQVYKYWKNNNVPGPKPIFPFGNFGEMSKRTKSLEQIITKYYFDYPDKKFIGIYEGRRPCLIVKDPDDIKNVLIKDFVNFRNRNLLINESPTSENLFHTRDDTWRLLRQKMTPIFSSGKIKGMFPLMQECVQQFHNYLYHLAENDNVREMRQLMSMFTIQLFSSCVLGINVNTLNDDQNIFKDMAFKMFEPRLKVSISRSIDAVFPGIIRAINISQHNQEIVDFFHSIVKSTLKEREGKQTSRKDFMDLLIDLKEQGHITGNSYEGTKQADVEITEMLITAQVLLFYAAGFETSSGTMSFLLHEMALNQTLQDKIHDEIQSVTEKYDGKITYDAVQEMKYLDMILSESLRKYPIGGVLVREAASNYTFPGTQLTIHKGVKVFIPVAALHKDPMHYPEPEKFIPERFSPESKNQIHQCTYLPFGEGPRNCIAARFAKTQSMVGVASILQKFRVVPSTQSTENLSFNPKAFTLQSANGIWLKILAR